MFIHTYSVLVIGRENSYLEEHTYKDFASFDVSCVKKPMLRNEESIKNLTEIIRIPVVSVEHSAFIIWRPYFSDLYILPVKDFTGK